MARHHLCPLPLVLLIASAPLIMTPFVTAAPASAAAAAKPRREAVSVTAALYAGGILHLFNNRSQVLVLPHDDAPASAKPRKVSQAALFKVPNSFKVAAAVAIPTFFSHDYYFFGAGDVFYRRNDQQMAKKLLRENVPRFLQCGFDAAATDDTTTYYFRRCYYVEQENEGEWFDEPKKMSELGLPCNVDAAWHDGQNTVVLKGDRVWRLGHDVKDSESFDEYFYQPFWKLEQNTNGLFNDSERYPAVIQRGNIVITRRRPKVVDKRDDCEYPKDDDSDEEKKKKGDEKKEEEEGEGGRRGGRRLPPLRRKPTWRGPARHEKTNDEVVEKAHSDAVRVPEEDVEEVAESTQSSEGGNVNSRKGQEQSSVDKDVESSGQMTTENVGSETAEENMGAGEESVVETDDVVQNNGSGRIVELDDAALPGVIAGAGEPKVVALENRTAEASGEKPAGNDNICNGTTEISEEGEAGNNAIVRVNDVQQAASNDSFEVSEAERQSFQNATTTDFAEVGDKGHSDTLPPNEPIELSSDLPGDTTAQAEIVAEGEKEKAVAGNGNVESMARVKVTKFVLSEDHEFED